VDVFRGVLMTSYISMVCIGYWKFSKRNLEVFILMHNLEYMARSKSYCLLRWYCRSWFLLYLDPSLSFLLAKIL